MADGQVRLEGITAFEQLRSALDEVLWILPEKLFEFWLGVFLRFNLQFLGLWLVLLGVVLLLEVLDVLLDLVLVLLGFILEFLGLVLVLLELDLELLFDLLVDPFSLGGLVDQLVGDLGRRGAGCTETRAHRQVHVGEFVAAVLKILDLLVRGFVGVRFLMALFVLVFVFVFIFVLILVLLFCILD